MLGKDRWFWAFNCANNEIGAAFLMQNSGKCAANRAKYWSTTHANVLARQLAARGTPYEEIEQAKHLFDENILTIGFARRFATYKRPNMLLHDPARLLRILTNPQKPVQLIISRQGHPRSTGPGIDPAMDGFHSNAEARPHVIFLSDYDMMLTERMVQGVDVWINTPRRPWEACGTSGMKVLANGGLNLSELDGWWVEAYSPEVGWAMGMAKNMEQTPLGMLRRQMLSMRSSRRR